MDFSKFSDAEFDAKEWVNGALRAHKESQTPVDAHASTLVMKLQLFIQEVNNALEETSLQVVQNLPRVLRDVESVRQEATLLREQMQIVKEDIKRVETETAHSMQRLVELDSIKSRMLESQNALQEADNWTTLSADVEEVFSSQDIHKIAEKVAGMQQSLVSSIQPARAPPTVCGCGSIPSNAHFSLQNVLHDVPDFEERKRLLENLKNRLEALLSPRLVAAFNAHSLDEAQQYIKMFSDIERYSQLRNYYIGCHKTEILQLWTSLHDPSRPLLEYLSSFYDELLAKWHSEYSWCSQVFLDPLSMLSSLFAQSLDALRPPLGTCVQSAVKGSSNSLTTLMELRQAALRFVKGLERALASVDDTSAILPLLESVHSPYCQLLVHYPSMEGQLLMQNLSHLQLSSPGSTEESISLISDSIPRVFTHASEALERCMLLTEGWGVCGVIKAIESLFSQYVSKLSGSMVLLRRECSLEERGRGKGERKERGEEWSHLQSAFGLIQCCGEMLLRTGALNSQLCSTVSAHVATLRAPSAPFGCYDYLTVYHPEEHTAVMELLTAVEKGGGEWPLLLSTTNRIHSLNEQAHTFAFDILFARLKEKLADIPHMRVWETGITTPLESPRAITDDLPSFSLSPLPYITEIGDYLLTLPQQLEPFTSQDSPALAAALRDGRLPFPDTDSGLISQEPSERGEDDQEDHPSDAWLGAIARGTMETYVQSILLIPSLPPQAALQLATDIAYLCNVLAALGQNPSHHLTQLELLFKADREEFIQYKGNTSFSGQLYQTVARLRTWQE